MRGHVDRLGHAQVSLTLSIAQRPGPSRAPRVQDGGGNPGHLPPGGPGDTLPDPDRRARAARHPVGLQAGSEQTQREVLLQVRGCGFWVSHDRWYRSVRVSVR